MSNKTPDFYPKLIITVALTHYSNNIIQGVVLIFSDADIATGTGNGAGDLESLARIRKGFCRPSAG